MSSVYWQPRTKLIWAIMNKIALTSQVSKHRRIFYTPVHPCSPQEDCRVTAIGFAIIVIIDESHRRLQKDLESQVLINESDRFQNIILSELKDNKHCN